jgi:hypothetical protein
MKILLIEVFSTCHWCQQHQWCTLSCKYTFCPYAGDIFAKKQTTNNNYSCLQIWFRLFFTWIFLICNIKKEDEVGHTILGFFRTFSLNFFQLSHLYCYHRPQRPRRPPLGPPLLPPLDVEGPAPPYPAWPPLGPWPPRPSRWGPLCSTRIFEKIWSGTNGIIRGLGKTDPCRKPEVENLVALGKS